MADVVNPNSSLDLLFWILSLYGIWLPSSYKGTWKELAYRVYTFFIMIGTYSAYLFTQFMDIYMNFGDMDKTIDTCSIGSCILAAAFKTLTIIFNQEKIQRIRDTLSSENFTNVDEENAKLMNKYTAGVRLVSRVYLTSSMMTIFLWMALPLFHNSDERKLPVRAWFPWDTATFSTALGYIPDGLMIVDEGLPTVIYYLEFATNKFLYTPVFYDYQSQAWKNYVALYIFQAVGVFIIACYNASQDLLVASFMILLCGELDMLCGDILSLGDEPQRAEETEDIVPLSTTEVIVTKKKRQDTNLRLKSCIIHQQKIVKCAKEVEAVFTSPLFVQFLLSCMTLCVVAFQMSTTKSSVELITHFVYISVLMTELMMFCYPGNELMLKSQQVSTAIYQSPWYDQDMEYKKLMITFMERTKHPIILTAGYILPLTIETLTSILQSSYSYYLVLQNLHLDE